jgi:hypothetical protein
MSTTPSEAAADAESGDERPGPVAWALIVTGWVVMVVAVLGAFGDDGLGGSWSWARWIVGAAVVHDAVVLPLVLGVGWLLARWLPAAFRVPVRSALVVGAIVSLAVWPIAARWGARADNPSILPLPVARNLAIMWVVLAVGALGVGGFAWLRQRGRGRGREELST